MMRVSEGPVTAVGDPGVWIVRCNGARSTTHPLTTREPCCIVQAWIPALTGMIWLDRSFDWRNV